MAEPLPILVGLTGKRKLLGQDDGLRATLDAIFQALETAFPFSPKVLVTGLADGADMLATELVLLRPGWLAYGLLPSPLEQFRETMTDDDSAGRLDCLLRHPRLSWRMLAPLDLPLPAAREAAIAPPVTESSLHYEQLGLWLAEHATILIAVRLTDEVADKVGGTMRVVNHRLCQPEPSMDSVAAAVTRISSELVERSLLDRVEGRAVWIVELPPTATSPRPLSHAIHLVPSQVETCRLKIVCQPSPKDVKEFFVQAADIDRFNQRIGGRVLFAWPTPKPDAVACLNSFRRTLTGIQGRAQYRWKCGVRALAVLFVIALMLLEAYAKLSETQAFAQSIGLTNWGMTAYTTIILACIGIYLLARGDHWQTIHEDYRAANEVLRTQRAFWQAGLTAARDRADCIYLVGVSGSLARVRLGAGAIITWVAMRSTPVALDWAAIHGSLNTYVEEQRGYFRRNAIKREKALLTVELSSWSCFAASLGMASWLAWYSACQTGQFRQVVCQACNFDDYHGTWWSWQNVIGVVVTWLLLRLQRNVCVRWAVGCLLVGILIFAPAMYRLGHDLGIPGEKKAPVAMVLVIAVMLLAIAGAIRFIAEKLAWDAEARAYQEAHDRFEYGLGRLEAIDRSGLDDDAKRVGKQAIIRELGTRALAENEAWLRAHRERPIEPLLGG